jgi:hypothetical protein
MGVARHRSAPASFNLLLALPYNLHGAGPKAPMNSGSTGYLEGGWGPLLPFGSWPGVTRIKAVQADLKRLFAAVDFVGVSNYAR